MSEPFPIPMEEVVDHLRLERDPRSSSDRDSFNVRCPLCDGNGYHMNINVRKNTYHCFHCGKGGGVLDLYSQYTRGTSASSVSTKELFGELMDALGHARDASPARYRQAKEKVREYVEIAPASDEKLDKVYRALLSLPYLQLTDEHRANLQKRGLLDDEIRENGYASMRSGETLVPMLLDEADPNSPKMAMIKEYYEKGDLAKIRKANAHLCNYTDADIQLGIRIALDVIFIAQTEPSNVPGFYKFGKDWAFRSVDAGILIPTRNPMGQIVGMQTRRDTALAKGLRYMTVSSKDLPDGVTTGIARAHFPKGEYISQTATIILTEGPLKADAAYSLMHQLGHHDVVFIALQGVNSVKELPDIASKLGQLGVPMIYDGFDIDKLVNPQVFRAMKTAQRILYENGNVTLSPLFWDRQYAELKANQMAELCRNSNISWNPTGELYRDMVTMSQLLTANHVNYAYIDIDGKRLEEKWSDKTKGIDDYLLSLLESTKAEEES